MKLEKPISRHMPVHLGYGMSLCFEWKRLKVKVDQKQRSDRVRQLKNKKEKNCFVRRNGDSITLFRVSGTL